MLATVKLRQSGYNFRLTFEVVTFALFRLLHFPLMGCSHFGQEFIQSYRVLLPNGLLSSRSDIEAFLYGLDLNRDNYQIGNTKVFLREAEKLLLDDALHQSIMVRVVCIQHWVRTQLCRRRFLKIRRATITVQVSFWTLSLYS